MRVSISRVLIQTEIINSSRDRLQMHEKFDNARF